MTSQKVAVSMTAYLRDVGASRNWRVALQALKLVSSAPSISPEAAFLAHFAVANSDTRPPRHAFALAEATARGAITPGATSAEVLLSRLERDAPLRGAGWVEAVAVANGMTAHSISPIVAQSATPDEAHRVAECFIAHSRSLLQRPDRAAAHVAGAARLARCALDVSPAAGSDLHALAPLLLKAATSAGRSAGWVAGLELIAATTPRRASLIGHDRKGLSDACRDATVLALQLAPTPEAAVKLSAAVSSEAPWSHSSRALSVAIRRAASAGRWADVADIFERHAPTVRRSAAINITCVAALRQAGAWALAARMLDLQVQRGSTPTLVGADVADLVAVDDAAAAAWCHDDAAVAAAPRHVAVVLREAMERRLVAPDAAAVRIVLDGLVARNDFDQSRHLLQAASQHGLMLPSATYASYFGALPTADVESDAIGFLHAAVQRERPAIAHGLRACALKAARSTKGHSIAAHAFARALVRISVSERSAVQVTSQTSVADVTGLWHIAGMAIRAGCVHSGAQFIEQLARNLDESQRSAVGLALFGPGPVDRFVHDIAHAAAGAKTTDAAESHGQAIARVICAATEIAASLPRAPNAAAVSLLLSAAMARGVAPKLKSEALFAACAKLLAKHSVGVGSRNVGTLFTLIQAASGCPVAAVQAISQIPVSIGQEDAVASCLQSRWQAMGCEAVAAEATRLAAGCSCAKLRGALAQAMCGAGHAAAVKSALGDLALSGNSRGSIACLEAELEGTAGTAAVRVHAERLVGMFEQGTCDVSNDRAEVLVGRVASCILRDGADGDPLALALMRALSKCLGYPSDSVMLVLGRNGVFERMAPAERHELLERYRGSVVLPSPDVEALLATSEGSQTPMFGLVHAAGDAATSH